MDVETHPSCLRRDEDPDTDVETNRDDGLDKVLLGHDGVVVGDDGSSVEEESRVSTANLCLESESDGFRGFGVVDEDDGEGDLGEAGD